MKREIKNSQTPVRNTWIVVAVISALTFFLGFQFDPMDAGAAISFVSVFLFITSIVVSFIFQKRKKALDKAIQEKKFIAHFKYSKNEWKQFMKYELEFRLTKNKFMFMLLSVLFIVIFGLFIIFLDYKLEMFLSMLAFIAFFAIIAYSIPYLSYLRGIRGDADVLIMEKGILFNRQFHNWDFPFSFLSSIGHRKKPNVLEVTYEFFDRLGPRTYTVNIPIPKGKHKDVNTVIDELARSNDLEEKGRTYKRTKTK